MVETCVCMFCDGRGWYWYPIDPAILPPPEPDMAYKRECQNCDGVGRHPRGVTKGTFQYPHERKRWSGPPV